MSRRNDMKFFHVLTLACLINFLDFSQVPTVLLFVYLPRTVAIHVKFGSKWIINIPPREWWIIQDYWSNSSKRELFFVKFSAPSVSNFPNYHSLFCSVSLGWATVGDGNCGDNLRGEIHLIYSARGDVICRLSSTLKFNIIFPRDLLITIFFVVKYIVIWSWFSILPREDYCRKHGKNRENFSQKYYRSEGSIMLHGWKTAAGLHSDKF